MATERLILFLEDKGEKLGLNHSALAAAGARARLIFH